MKKQQSRKNPKESPFDAWMKQLDEYTANNVGVSIYDLPDLDFQTGFNLGLTPQEFFDEEVASNLDDL